MADSQARPSLRRWSLFSVGWHLSTWLGWALVVIAAGQIQPLMGTMSAAFWVIAVLVLLGELRPVLTAKGTDPQGIVTSTAFLLATLYLWGLWPAVLLQAFATVVGERAKGKATWKLFFNVGQYELSLLAAWGVLALGGYPEGLGDDITGASVALMVGSWFVWFLTNNALVSMLAGSDGKSFWDYFTGDFAYYFLETFAVMTISPLVVIAAQESVWLLPLTAVPLEAVRLVGRISLDEQYASRHDPLTGLPNRKLLMTTLDDQLKGCVRRCEPFALFLLDLDRFKEVNDTLGHQTGDRLLEIVARRIQGQLRDDDMVARLGGDEFAVFVPHITNANEAADVAIRVRDALVEPVQLDDVLIQLEASLGVALHPRHGAEVGTLMRRADVAMYLAKETRSEIEVYDPARDRHSTDRLGLLAALRHAIDSESLEVHYQPKVSLTDDRLVGMEALVRWDHPERGLIAPDEFIPLAETSGLMERLTAYVIDRALTQVALWRGMGYDVSVAVNVSARDLHGSLLARTVSESLARHRVPATRLQLELTERTLMAEHSRVLDTIEALEALDIALSLDDFGTGYSSMFMLKRLPVNEIKIDRSFVSRLADNDEDLSIARSIIELAHALGLHAVAEGVESEQTWEALRELGCDAAQGWFVAEPMSAADAAVWLAAREGVAGGKVLTLVTDRASGE